MDRLALVLAVLALGAAAYVHVDSQATPVRTLDPEGLEGLRAQVASLTEEVRALREAAARAPLAGTPPAARDATPAGPGLVGRGDPSTGTAVAVAERTLAERIAALETWREETVEDFGATREVGGLDFGPDGSIFRSRDARLVLTDADAAQRRLDLSAGQRADLDRILDETKHEMDRLLDTPNEDGTTLRSLQEGMNLAPGSPGVLDPSRILGQVGRLMAFKQGVVPGTDETYAAAEERLRSTAKRRIRDSLGEQQQRTWDRSHTDPLIPRAGTGGMVSVGFSSVNVFGTDDTDDAASGR